LVLTKTIPNHLFSRFGDRRKMIDQKKIKKAVVMILEAIGEDPTREGLIETPDRIARMYSEIFAGIGETAEVHLSKTFTVKSDDIVIERDIPFYSMCEHHLLPFYGKVHIAYIPNGKVAGLSKLVRTVALYSQRAQLQELLTTQIGEAIMEYLHARGVMVIIEAEHLCMNMRGIKRPGSKTITAMQAGIFKNNRELKDEVHHLMCIR
jgi:GTP cyclohydrolase I